MAAGARTDIPAAMGAWIDWGDEVNLTLPWPPSVNRMWRNVNGKTLLAADGRRYREEVLWKVKAHSGRFITPVRVIIMAWYPDRRRRDIDNILKAPLDALTHAGVWSDDSLIECLSIEKAGYSQHEPRLDITIQEIA
jgi:crossover junction endodeoxyribonuclease RusA